MRFYAIYAIYANNMLILSFKRWSDGLKIRRRSSKFSKQDDLGLKHGDFRLSNDDSLL